MLDQFIIATMFLALTITVGLIVYRVAGIIRTAYKECIAIIIAEDKRMNDRRFNSWHLAEIMNGKENVK